MSVAARMVFPLALLLAGCAAQAGDGVPGSAADGTDARLAQNAAPPPPAAGAPLPWQAPGASGTVTAPPPPPAGTRTATPSAPGQRECREFEQTIAIAGETRQAYGITCRQADGTWRIVP
ncbi:MAG: hypothetical protein JO010_12150 [Alphaproteobacteria bacterium]|nr:hypothetical protein [Alphaproteobacteria bacterium]